MAFFLCDQLLAVGDCWPEAVKLSKGEHIVRVQVRPRLLSFLACCSMCLRATRPCHTKNLPMLRLWIYPIGNVILTEVCVYIDDLGTLNWVCSYHQ